MYIDLILHEFLLWCWINWTKERQPEWNASKSSYQVLIKFVSFRKSVSPKKRTKLHSNKSKLVPLYSTATKHTPPAICMWIKRQYLNRCHLIVVVHDVSGTVCLSINNRNEQCGFITFRFQRKYFKNRLLKFCMKKYFIFGSLFLFNVLYFIPPTNQKASVWSRLNIISASKQESNIHFKRPTTAHPISNAMWLALTARIENIAPIHKILLKFPPYCTPHIFYERCKKHPWYFEAKQVPRSD